MSKKVRMKLTGVKEISFLHRSTKIVTVFFKAQNGQHGIQGRCSTSKQQSQMLLHPPRSHTLMPPLQIYEHPIVDLHSCIIQTRILGREEEATRAFAQIQHAYQVLSDPQERAWYDRIRAEQQRHHHTNKNDQHRWGTEEVMRLFEADVYTAYDDTPKGFFSIFRQVFEHLESLEGTEDDEQVTFFGSQHSPFVPAVKTFYDKWLGFNSKRTDFVTPSDAYFEHYQQGTNRRDRRYLEKERERGREAARKEYSEAVRNLAAYVRKRDPRYKTYLLQRKKANQEQEELRKKQAKESRRQAAFVEQEWTKLDKEEEELLRRLEQLNPFSDEEEEEEDEEEYYCVACKKTFKSQKQWKNHEQSRKHLVELSKFKDVERVGRLHSIQ